MRFHRAYSRIVVCQTRVHRALGHFVDRDSIGGAASRCEGDTDDPIGDHACDPAYMRWSSRISWYSARMSWIQSVIVSSRVI